ncbi:MAG: cytochrome C oxidase subunit IV family protein [Acidimicrobiia bacterium]
MSTEGTAAPGTVATTASSETELERFEDLVPDAALRHAPGLLPGELKEHPDPLQYVIVAVVLVVITGIEIGTSYLEGSIPNGLLIGLLLVMAFVKFFLVASWFMHLRTDQPVFRRFFIIGSIAAVLLYAAVLLMLHVSF